MRRSAVFSLLGATAAAFSVTVAAQDKSRVIEETLILRDPTVAAQDKWLLGGAIEGFYIYGPYRARLSDGSVEKGEIHALKPGTNIFAGYDDFTLNYVYRRGTEKIDTHHSATAQIPFDYDHTRRFKTNENELSLRWRLRHLDGSWYSPYVYVAFVHLRSDNTDTITTGGVTFGNGTNEERSQITAKTGYIGLGGIFPLDEKKGVRLDAALNYTKARWDFENETLHGSGIGGRATATMYYAFSEGWNAQLGARFDGLRAPPSIFRYRFGLFGMLGYTHRF